MNFKKLFLFVLILISLSLFSVFAIDFSITGQIEEYSSGYREFLDIKLDCNEDINLTFPDNSQNIFYNNISYKQDYIFLDNCQSNNIISYDGIDIEKLETYSYRIERKFSNYDNINYSYKLIIPITYSVNGEKTFPKNYTTNIINSTKEIRFEKNDLYLLYLIKDDSLDKKINLEHFIEELKEPIVIILLIFTTLISIVLTLIYFKKTSKKAIQQSVPSFVLSKEEKEVLDILKQNPGINQKQIGKELDLSKSKISSIVNDLEQKQLLKREKFGRSFKVYINKNIH